MFADAFSGRIVEDHADARLDAPVLARSSESLLDSVARRGFYQTQTKLASLFKNAGQFHTISLRRGKSTVGR